MEGGSFSFKKDIQEVFADIISRYNYHFTKSDFTSVELSNNTTDLSFYINEEVVTMYIEAGGIAYKVNKIARIADKQFYLEWLDRLDNAGKGLLRDEYYKNWLVFLHELSVKFLGNAWETGIVPFGDTYVTLKAQEDSEQAAFSRAWEAMQKLDYSDPVRQKYIADDASWVNDMIGRLDSRE